jgi:hypothetical protein
VGFGPSSFKVQVILTFSSKLKELSIELIVAVNLKGSELPWTPPFSGAGRLNIDRNAEGLMAIAF